MTGRLVLGIDAAWTSHGSSGLALVRDDGGWSLLGVWPCYSSFQRNDGADEDPAQSLIAACIRTAGAPPDLVTVDMPLALTPITARRVSDNEISRTYGGGVQARTHPRPHVPVRCLIACARALVPPAIISLQRQIRRGG